MLDAAHIAYYEELMACHDHMVLNLLRKLEEGKDIENVIKEGERLEKLWQNRLDTLRRNVRPDLRTEYCDFYCENFTDKLAEVQEVVRWARHKQKVLDESPKYSQE